MSFLTKPRKVAIGAGAGLGLAGVAFAAVTLSTSFGGLTAYEGGTASMTVESVSISQQTGGMKCLASGANNAISIDATGRNLNGVFGAQGCRVNAVIKNTGNSPVKLTGVDFNPGQEALRGWQITPNSSVPQTIAPNGTATFSATLGIPAGRTEAQVGAASFTGKLNGTAE